MGSFGANFEDLVPKQDKFYFGNATVKGIRDQLRDNGLATGGVKYNLYQRLVENGLRLYNDPRSDDIKDEDNGEPDDGDEDPFEEPDSELDDSEADYTEENDSVIDDSEDDDISDEDDGLSEDDQLDDGQQQGDQGGDNQGGENQGDDQGGDDQGGDDQRGDDQGGKQPPRSDKKRGRDDDDDDDDNDDDDDGDGHDRGPPARRRRRLGIALPPEILAIIIESLNAPGIWNLIDTAPEEYLSEEFDALVLEARYQHRLDYPPPLPIAIPGGGDVRRATVPNPWPGPGPERPLSLLEWVARRANLDSRFRAANRTRIMRVIDAYLQVYGMADPTAPEPNAREQLLYYFRNRIDILFANHLTPLMHAAQNHNPGAVQLLLMRGADVNEVVNGATALQHAAAAGFFVGPAGYHTMQTAFALVGAGANVTGLSNPAWGQTLIALQFLTQGPVPRRGLVEPGDFPRIDNMGLSIRQFIADERSNPYDRDLLTLFVIGYGTLTYSRYI